MNERKIIEKFVTIHKNKSCISEAKERRLYNST